MGPAGDAPAPPLTPPPALYPSAAPSTPQPSPFFLVGAATGPPSTPAPFEMPFGFPSQQQQQPMTTQQQQQGFVTAFPFPSAPSTPAYAPQQQQFFSQNG